MGRKPVELDKNKMELVGLYENPTADDIDRINKDITLHENRKQHEKNMAEGFRVVGMYGKDTPEEEKARLLATAQLNREPTDEEVEIMLKSMRKADVEYKKRKEKRDNAKAEKARIRELLASQNIDYIQYMEREEDIEKEASMIARIVHNGEPPQGESRRIAEYLKREVKEAKQRKGQRDRRKARLEQEKE